MTKKIIFSLLVLAMFSVIFTSCDDSDPVAAHEDHVEASGFLIKDVNGKVVFKEQKGQLDTSIDTSFTISMGDQPISYSVEFLAEDGDILGELDEHHSLQIDVENTDIASAEILRWNFDITPHSNGETKFRVIILHEDHPDFTSPYFNMVIE